MTTEEMIAVMQAFDEGKQIQIATKDGPGFMWYDIEEEPSWNFNDFDYRVKPEPQKPKLRPYANAEEFLLAQKEHGQYLNFETLGRVPIYKFPIYISDSEFIVLDFGIDSFVYRDYSTLLDEAKWQDGTPCGIMEE